MKQPTYGEWARTMIRSEAEVMSRRSSWKHMRPIDRRAHLLDKICRRVGITSKERSRLFHADQVVVPLAEAEETETARGRG